MTVALSSRGRPGAEAVEAGAERLDLEAGHVGGHELDVAADVADAVGGAGELGVGPPGGLLLARVLELGRQPLLGILAVDEADLADLARGDEVAEVLDDGIARIGVGDAEEEPGLADEAGQLGGVAAELVASGFSQTTEKPCSRASLAAG